MKAIVGRRAAGDRAPLSDKLYSIAQVQAGNAVQDRTARDNLGDGIQVGIASMVTSCVAYRNGDALGEDGIVAGTGSAVTDSISRFNWEDGIQVSSDSYVARNNCDSNGQSGSGAGVRVTSSDNRIEANNVTDNVVGIDAETGNIVVKNTAANNSVDNYDVTGGIFEETSVYSTEPWINYNF